MLWFLGRNAEAREKAVKAIEALQPLGESAELAMAYSNQSQLHMLAQEHEACIRRGTAAIEMAIRLGDHSILAQALNNVGVSEMQAAAETAHMVVSNRGASAISRLPAMAVLGRVRARRGDPGAQQVLDEARDLAKRTGEFQRIAPVASARAEAAWPRGDTHAAGREAEEAFAMSAGLHEWWARGDLAIWLWRSGAQNLGDDIAEPYRLQIAGQWREAAAAFESVGRPYESAVALSDGDDPTEIQRAIGEGLRNADIAARLFVSAKTVDHHISSILSKLGAKTRGEAANKFAKMRV